MNNTLNIVENYFVNATPSIKEILFIPNTAHPIWQDSEEVISLAKQQILDPLGVEPDEKILAFIGIHSKTIITGKRDSIGFVITNLRVLSQTDFKVIGDVEKAKSFKFYKNINPKEFTENIWSDFTNNFKVQDELLVNFERTFVDIVTLVLQELQSRNLLKDTPSITSDINIRIQELGLSNAIQKFDANSKKFKKFALKYQVDDIKYGLLDQTLFGGVYGTVLTTKGIVSRDLLEEAVTCSWEDISKYPATQGEKKAVILAGLKILVIPQHVENLSSNFIKLLNEIASKQVFIL